MSAFTTTHLHDIAADAPALLMREAIDKMDKGTFEWYLKYHFATCERINVTGITSHTLDVFRKQL